MHGDRLRPVPDFPTYLQHAMDAAGLPTSADVQRAAQAAGLDVDQNLVSRWLRGEMKQPPTVAKLRPVATVLGIPLNEMMVAAGLVTPDEVGLDRQPRLPATIEERMRADKRLTPGKAEIMIQLLHEFREEHSSRTGVRIKRHVDRSDQDIDTGGDEELSG
jgi:transcriptional regulator with XRE-family HTH domain